MKQFVDANGPLTEAEQTALLSFLGFGNPKAEYVFIGMEEGLSSPPSLLEQLRIRAAFPNMIGLKESAKAHPDKFLSGDRPPIQRTWNTIIRVLLSLDGNHAPTGDHIRLYQRDELALASGSAALLELMPLPSRSIAEWDNAPLFASFKSRDQYLASFLPYRVHLLRDHLSYQPRLVMAYGKAYWPHFKKLFDASEWVVSGPFDVATVGRTKIILTPHFTARSMNGQIDALLKLVMG